MTQTSQPLIVPTLTRSSSLSSRSHKLQKEAPSLVRFTSLSNRASPSPLTVSRSKSFPHKSSKPVLITPPVRSSSLQQDQEIAKSLIAWKHQSAIKEVDWNNLFSNGQGLWQGDEAIFELEDTVKENEVKRITELVWSETFVKKKEIASYLGKWDPFHHKVLVAYMNYFDFSLKSLEEAFRLLCSKLYFKAEAQEIDRILEAFAYRYWIQNATDPIYLHADIVYAITYSIMLLNTDLYVIQSNSHTKMSCASFCENLMSTLNEFGLELNQETTTERLKEIYFSIKQQGILQPQNGPKSFLKRIGSRRVKSPQQTF